MTLFRGAARRRFGFVTVYIVFTTFILLPVVGMAIDFSVLYLVRARLQQGADAAVIGAGSMVQRSTNLDDPVQKAAIENATRRFFNANYESGFWRSTQLAFAGTAVQDSTKLRTITVTASYKVPMFFMRALNVANSMVNVRAEAKIRFVNMVILVDRSASVQMAGNGPIITNALRKFVDPDPAIDKDGQGNPIKPIFVQGRDVVGLVSFGTTWQYNYPLDTNFQTASSGHPRIRTAIAGIDYSDTSNYTNTGDGLFHSYRYLEDRNELGALNVILLLTDGRPTAFSSNNFVIKTSGTPSPCTNKADRAGVIIGKPLSTGVFPPGTSDANTGGVFKSTFTGDDGAIITNSAGCKFATNTDNVEQDIKQIPTQAFPPDDNASNRWFSTQSGVYGGSGTDISKTRQVRYAAINVADNIADTIRKDTNVRPVLYVIGLNANKNGLEPLDANWLARVANDPNWVSTTSGTRVYQPGQTPGRYYNVNNGSGLEAALQDITSQILRLSL